MSIALHLLLVLLAAFPFFGSTLVAEMTGAGGPGTAGGGGGGNNGTGGRVANERVQYVVPVRQPPAASPKPVPPTRPQPPVPQPPVPPPRQETPPPVPQPAPVQPAPAAVSAAASEPLGRTAGSGGDPGRGAGAGSGPGSGGGVGSGIGAGRGSAVGDGTGGGSGTIFPPTPSELFIPPLPVPPRVKGKTITIVFDVDSTGKVLEFDLTPTRDAAYNRKLREILASTRFRPATDGTGRPVRAKYNLDYTF